MKRFLGVLFTVISFVSYSQISWDYSHEQISENEVELIFFAKIDKTWKLYSQFKYDSTLLEAPLPLEFHFDASDSYELLGETKENTPSEAFDPIFEISVKYFKNRATFKQKIKVLSKEKIEINGTLFWQICDPKACMSGEETITFSINLIENLFNKEESSTKGCRDPNASNFDSIVNEDCDGITLGDDFSCCLYAGCTDSSQSNYNPKSNIDDGSCYLDGCTDSVALNYNSEATKLDNSCKYPEKEHNLYDDPLVNLKDPAANCGANNDDEEESNSLWWIFLLGIGGGILALITPCVFPMIPLTVSFFTKGKSEKGIFNAAMYGLFIMLIYFLLSIPFHIMPNIDPEILNQISTNTWLNILFFLIFIAFAFSFFGYYELTLPSKWGNKADSGSNIGGLIGIFFMALTLAIVSFSCTGPILGTLLAGTLGGDVSMVSFMGMEFKMVATKLTVGMTGFGLALGLPFALFALFPKFLNALPQSGGWLNSVKVVLGFLEVALAIKFLSNADMVEQWGLIKRETYFLLWFIVGVLTVLYLVGKIKFPHDAPLQKISKTRYGFIVLFTVFTIYLIPGIFGSHLNWWEHKLLSGFPPPLAYSYTYPEEEEVFKDYWEAIEYSKKVNKPIFIDFTGWNCTNCRDMEENVFPEVKDLLDQYVICKLYVDEKIKLPDSEIVIVPTNDGGSRKKILSTVGDRWSTLQITTYNKTSQPWYVLYSWKDGLLTHPIGKTKDIEEFSKWLECGLEAYENQE